MTSTDLERLLTSALQHHAEEAMNDTDTETRLSDLFDENERQGRRRRNAWATGAVAAAVAVVAALAWWPGLGEPDSAPDPVNSPAEMNSAEQLAHDFVTAYFAFDRDRAVAYVTDKEALTLNIRAGKDGWLTFNRMLEASGFDAQVDTCYQTQALTPEGARVGCLFTYHDWGSEELNRGPFEGNLFDITIHSGQIYDATISYTDDPNGFDDQMLAPFMAWFDEAHPGETATMELWSSPEADAAELEESLALWTQWVQEYVDAVKAGEAD